MNALPLRIGGMTIEKPFILAPLAGYTDLPFRLLCREYGAGLVVSEMISCHGLTYNQRKTWDMLRSTARERPVIMQLFGAEPEVMGRAAALIADLAIDGIDINMGCPVRKVVKKGAGCALMRSPELAAAVIRAVRDNCDKPVTVKFRSGWDHRTITAPAFARMAEEAGASALTIHARTWSDGFSGTVDWEVIGAVKKAVSIPVIGNGDIKSRQEGFDMMARTGCDGVMIGRGALGRPWIFAGVDSPSPMLRLSALSRHLQLIREHLGPDIGLGAVRNHAGRYFKGMQNGSAIRNTLFQMRRLDQLRGYIDRLVASLAKEPKEHGENEADKQ